MFYNIRIQMKSPELLAFWFCMSRCHALNCASRESSTGKQTDNHGQKSHIEVTISLIISLHSSAVYTIQC